MKKFFERYLDLRLEVDKKCNELWNIHRSMMNCKPGCSACCQAFRILPVEYEWIKKQLKNRKVEINDSNKSDACKFLLKGKCSIYDERPIICRTHGFPLVRYNEEYEAYDISYCHLNFKDTPMDSFDETNVYYEDVNNSKLYELNQEFLTEYNSNNYEPIQLLELNGIANELK